MLTEKAALKKLDCAMRTMRWVGIQSVPQTITTSEAVTEKRNLVGGVSYDLNPPTSRGDILAKS